MSYYEYQREFETEVGHVQVIYISNTGHQHNFDEIHVYVNHKRIHVPSSWLTQTTSTIVKKVCKLVNSAKLSGVRIGGPNE